MIFVDGQQVSESIPDLNWNKFYTESKNLRVRSISSKTVLLYTCAVDVDTILIKY